MVLEHFGYILLYVVYRLFNIVVYCCISMLNHIFYILFTFPFRCVYILFAYTGDERLEVAGRGARIEMEC